MVEEETRLTWLLTAPQTRGVPAAGPGGREWRV